MILQTLTLCDVEQILNIERQCFSMPWSREQCMAVFKQKHFFALGLKQEQLENELVAYISLYQVLDELEILNIAVLPQFRRQGLGEYLLINTLQGASKMGMNNAVLEVRINNVAARTLYERVGFVCVGSRPKYYADTGEDALIYNLDLSGDFITKTAKQPY